MLKHRFILIGWLLLGTGVIVLLVSAMKQKEHKACAAIDIVIIGAHEHVFVDENDVKNILKENGADIGKDISLIDLKSTEQQLQKDAWIKKAELFFDNKQTLEVKIDEREPLARVFTLDGNSFYIDSSGMRLPLSDQQTARVPVFTSFTSSKNVLSSPDSSLLVDIKTIAQFIHADSFWEAMISQINITPQRNFELVPVLGNQIIELGNVDSLDAKFDRLYTFYKTVWTKAGFEKYEKIDVQYDGEVVATIRGAAKPFSDSSKAVQMLGNSATRMNNVMKDTTYAAPLPAMFKDSTHAKPSVKIIPRSKQKPVIKTKPALKPSTKKVKPKATMQKKKTS